MQSGPGLPLIRSSPSSPSTLVLEAVAVSVSDALVPLITVVHDEVAPLVPADSMLAAASAATRVVSTGANRILLQR